MPQKLTFTTVNSQVVASDVEVEVEGEKMMARRARLIVEAVPADPLGKTLTLVLPADALEDYPAGGTIEVTVKPVAPKGA